jgi:diguanylate cyclase (GGDEF)-like protein/PAS domain S-box-containing protein
MSIRDAARSGLAPVFVGGVTVGWVCSLIAFARVGDATTAQLTSNVGLTAVSLLAGAAAVARGRREGELRRFWRLLGAACLSWSAGMAVWTWYESLVGREVPFPSLADVGYLGFPAFGALALLSLPLTAQTLAGRLRVLLDGLIVALSLLLVSWIVVLEPVLVAGGDSVLAQWISVAYPASDVVVITIVVYTGLRARQSARRPSVSLSMVGWGLLAFAFSDSGFVYLTTSSDYSSGNLIDIGWFTGFALLLLAALRVKHVEAAAVEDESLGRQLGTFLPYSAVLIAVGTSVIEMVQHGSPDSFISWDRSALILSLVVRQILTLRENFALTANLEDRVAARTAELQSSRQRFAALAQHSSDVVTVIDSVGRITYQSESSQRVLGRPAEAMTGSMLWEFMPHAEAAALRDTIAAVSLEPLRLQTVQSLWLRADGKPCHLEVTVTNLLRNKHVGGLVLNSRDITDRTALEEQLLHQAFHDSLTGLFNRAMFKERLEHALSRRGRDSSTLGVLFLDLDGFKLVNDTLGHSTGDALLVQVSNRLLSLVRPSDTVARFGGDEFAILVEDLQDAEYTTTLAERVNRSLRDPYDLSGTPVHLSVSVGIAHDDDTAADAEQVLRNADLAMYQAKTESDGGYAVYDPSMHAGLVDRVQLERDLRSAVDDGRLILHYQPLINMSSGRVTGVEALARWDHPDRGLIPPQEFIPLAEATGLIRRLGYWVLREACTQAVKWHRLHPGLADLNVGVNISPRQLDDPTLADYISSVLEETGLRAELLTIEMTESVLMSDSPEALATLAQLREMGVRLAIDDFGTGYSSLSYLHRFPVDILKIDRSFVDQLSRDGHTALVSTIVRLGHTMSLETVAEGIERPEEMLLLRRQGCTTGQGFHFSPPISGDDLVAFLWERVSLAVVRDDPA